MNTPVSRSLLSFSTARSAAFTTTALAALLLLPLSAPAARALAPAPAAAAAGNPAPAQASPSGFGAIDPTPPSNLSEQQIIAKFGTRETAFDKARQDYTFRQTVTVQTISDDTGKPDGQYQQVTDIVFDDHDRRTEHVVFAPQNTIEKVIMSQADFDDIEHRLPFVLTTPELPQYNLTYLGRQKVDDIDTYVFDCKPKELVKNKRYFQGKVWVDQQELEIVLITGKSVPDNLRRGHEDLSPPYTTYYQEVDGGNWFPVYTKAEGILHFPKDEGGDVHIRYVVKYEDYKRFHAKSRIIYNGEELPPTDPKATVPATPTTPTGATSDTAPDMPPPDPNAPALTRPKPKQ